MEKTFLHIAFIVSTLQTFSAVAVAASMTEQAKEMAQKDYRSAMAKIKLANEAEMLECAKRRGPAAKACEIQTNGKRAAAEDQAKLTLDDVAGTEPPASDVEKQKAAKNEARVAKTSYGMDKARIAAENKQALVQCKELKREERKTCNAEVALRTEEAYREARSIYDRSVAKAKAISAR